MDFSAAQRAAHAEEYADAIIAITPGFSQLSAEAQKAERKHFMREAEKVKWNVIPTSGAVPTASRRRIPWSPLI
jgi:hypothetical protein